MTRRPPMRVFFHADYNRTSCAKETTRKATRIAESLRDRPIDGVELVAPRSSDREELLEVHAARYVDAVASGEPYGLASSAGLGWDDDLFASTAASTGGTRDAVLHALTSGGVAGSLSSGLHHARHDTGVGFCTFNGLVVGARAALAAGAARVAVLDLDAHCGGGTASLIDDIDGIEQVDVSVSSFDGYTSRPDARLVMSDGADYLDDVSRALDSIESPTSIDVVIYNAGMDPHRGSGGPSAIDTDVIARREAMVFAWASAHGLPVAWALAGGYLWGGITMDELVDLHRLTVSTAAAA